MKTLDAAKLTDIAGRYFRRAMLAFVAMLCIRFIRRYVDGWVRYKILYMQTGFNCAYAQKRVGNKVVHDRKYAIFPGNPNSRAGLFGKWQFCCMGGTAGSR